MITFTVPGQPRTKGRPRFNPRTGRARTPESTRKAEERIVEQYIVTGYQVDPQDWPVEFDLTLRFYLRTGPLQKWDMDNGEKLILDALNGAVWADDSQIWHVEKWRYYNSNLPRTAIEIRERLSAEESE